LPPGLRYRSMTFFPLRCPFCSWLTASRCLTISVLLLLAGCAHKKVTVRAVPLGGVPGGIPGGTVWGVQGGVAAAHPASPQLQANVGASAAALATKGQAPSRREQPEKIDCPILIFACPQEMEYGVWAHVTAVIAPKYTDSLADELRSLKVCEAERQCKEVMKSVCNTGYLEVPAARLWRINVAPMMTVTLHAPDFEVKSPPTFSEQNPIQEFAAWNWQIKPVSGPEKREISFELHSRRTGAEAPTNAHLRGHMSRVVTVTGATNAELKSKVAKAAIDGIGFTFGKTLQILVSALITSALGAYLKRKWPNLIKKDS
jgi:hypothetical protein